MNIVRKIKLKIIDNPKYKSLTDDERKDLINSNYRFIRDSQYAQYKGLNTCMSYIVSGFYIFGMDLKNEEFKELLKSVSNSNPIFDNIEFGKGIDSKSLITQKVKKDFSTAIKNGLAKGERTTTNYKRNNPLLTRGRDLKIKYKDDKEDTIVIDWVNSIRFEAVLGWKKNSIELKHTLHKVINGEYKVATSSLGFNNKNELILNLNLNIPERENKGFIEDRTLGVDLGMATPVYMSVNDDFTIRKALGSFDEMIKVRTQFKNRVKKLQKQLSLSNTTNKGDNKKLDNLREKENNFIKTYHHQLSRSVVDFALKNQCEYINLEKITSTGLSNNVIALWGYYQLQSFIEYKANLVGIKVRYINPCNTSTTCSRCGHTDKDNRLSQSEFKCTKCGFELNADWNASINIANSTDYVGKKKSKSKK